ncbi:MAG: hypothetical protein WB709_06030 [Solirubrobacteraceae bacterium]
MFKITSRLRLAVIVATTLTVAAFAGSVSAGSALANHGGPPTLNGTWALFNRCPVDDPVMLAADGATNSALCLAVSSPSGSLKIGNLALTTKSSSYQIGLNDNVSTEVFTAISPPDGAIVDEASEVPGGLQSLICPSRARYWWGGSCREHRYGGGNYGLNNTTATVVSAGDPYNIDLFLGLELGHALDTLPVKIHLQNPLLGENCYIGSDAEPIVLQPENLSLTEPPINFGLFEANGTPNLTGPLSVFQFFNGQGSSSFAVPAASGCGFRGVLDQAINHNVGLPSPVGSNTVTYNEVTNSLATFFEAPLIPNEGKELSNAWHSAVVGGKEHGHGHGPGSGHGPGDGSGHGHWLGIGRHRY